MLGTGTGLAQNGSDLVVIWETWNITFDSTKTITVTSSDDWDALGDTTIEINVLMNAMVDKDHSDKCTKTIAGVITVNNHKERKPAAQYTHVWTPPITTKNTSNNWTEPSRTQSYDPTTGKYTYVFTIPSGGTIEIKTTYRSK